MPYPRVSATDKAVEVIEKLKKEHGDLVFHQSGGCCDGSAPMCFPKDEFMVGACDVKVGQIAGCDFFMSEDLFEYNKYTHLTIDVVEGRGSSFSLEIPLGLRFVAIPRLFTKEELEDLEPVERME
ncbi:MAG: DUF779 domain-containing protein [Epsilonproteobacteria bacterium]|nr:DUF779 domain-containing protein [Campylobacterota bacterium]NPA65235.1 DUF779 domain-containing protein [Campylobacterota bacterium]